MRCLLAIFGMSLCMTLIALPADQAGSSTQSQKNTPSKSKRKAQSTTLTGCVDEKDGDYVLVEDRTLREIAQLHAVSFDKEGFAKYLGHKVSVRGQMQSEGERPVLRVTGIETISGECTPPQGANQ